MTHLGERAELYALGALDSVERAAVDAHAAACIPCSRALASAEATVIALEDALAPAGAAPDRLGERIAASARASSLRRAQSIAAPGFTRPLTLAAAACIVAVSLASSPFALHRAALGTSGGDAAARSAMLHSHFRHVPFRPAVADAPTAKLLYAPDARWFYVVAENVREPLRVTTIVEGASQTFGALEDDGDIRTLFLRGIARPTAVRLERSDGRVISVATPVFLRP